MTGKLEPSNGDDGDDDNEAFSLLMITSFWREREREIVQIGGCAPFDGYVDDCAVGEGGADTRYQAQSIKREQDFKKKKK